MCDQMKNQNQLTSIRIFHLFCSHGKMANCSKSQNEHFTKYHLQLFFGHILCILNSFFFFISLHINIVSHCQLFGWTVIESNKVVWLTYICILFVFFHVFFSDSILDGVNFCTSLIVRCIKFFNGSIQWQKPRQKQAEKNHTNDT